MSSPGGRRPRLPNEPEAITANWLFVQAREEMAHGTHAGYRFMMWYVDEQVEEESGVTAILDKLRLIGGNTGLLLTLDNELAARVFVNPFPAGAK